jgi:hypothetical protein
MGIAYYLRVSRESRFVFRGSESSKFKISVAIPPLN